MNVSGLLLALVLALAGPQAVADQTEPGSSDLADRVLATLPAEALLAQAHRVVDMILGAHGIDGAPASLRATLRGQVLADLAALDLPGHWRRALAELPAPTLANARDRLSQPVMQRVREAEAAPAGAAQWQSLRDYRLRLRDRPPGLARTALVTRIVDATRNARLAALLQTGMERLLMERAVAAGVSLNRPAELEWAWLAEQRYISLRNAQIEYSFFSYRYLSNTVLEQILATVEQGPVAVVNQRLVDVASERLLP